jgi:hypothetical protein
MEGGAWVQLERVRLAWHEAGHAAVAHALGVAVHVVSVLPTRRWPAVCIHDGVLIPGADDFQPWVPLVCQPLELRSAIERKVVIALAGKIAEQFVADDAPASAYVPDLDEDEQAAAEAVEAMVGVGQPALSPEERELLAVGDDDAPPQEPDEARAWAATYALAGEAAAFWYLGVLRAIAQSILAEPCVRAGVRRLALELLEREVVGARRVRELLEGSPPGDPKPAGRRKAPSAVAANYYASGEDRA